MTSARRSTLLVLVAGASAVFVASCVPAPQQALAVRLLGDLAGARAALATDPSATAATCPIGGDARNKLYGTPGVAQDRPPWQTLLKATDALNAACGLLRLADEAHADTAEARAAQHAWRQRASRELVTACGYLRQSAKELGRQDLAPSCPSSSS